MSFPIVSPNSVCEGILAQFDDQNQDELCLRCECNYESRNAALIAVSQERRVGGARWPYTLCCFVCPSDDRLWDVDCDVWLYAALCGGGVCAPLHYKKKIASLRQICSTE